MFGFGKKKAEEKKESCCCGTVKEDSVSCPDGK